MEIYLNNTFTFFFFINYSVPLCKTGNSVLIHLCILHAFPLSLSQFVSLSRIPAQLRPEIPLLLLLSVFHLHSLFPTTCAV